LIGLALGAAFVNAREPVKASAPSRSVEPIVEDEAATDLMEVSDREPWNEVPEPSITASVTRGGKGGGVDVAPALVGPAADGTLSVLVHFDPQADRAAVAGVDSPVRASMRNFVNQQRAWVQHEYEILPNVVNIRGLTPQAVAALKRLPGVTKVEEDYKVHTYHNDSMPLIRAYQSQIIAAGYSATGAGIRCCVIDTGIDSNSIMYSTRIDAAAGWDFVNNDSNPEDDNGHGSHVSGTVLGGTNVNADFACATTGPESMQGVAPAATLIGVKVLDAAGSGSFSNVIAGINRCASTTLPGGQADVISLSLGGGQYSGTCDTDTAAIAVNNAVAAGVVVVVAAGNDGYTNAVGTPACASGAITVAATYDDNFPNCDFPTQTSFNWGICIDNNPVVDQRCCFSNRSTKLDVAAPGCNIYSDDSTVAAGNGLTSMCGTSQATPHVAGLAALLLDVNPSLTPADVRAHIRNGAIDLGTAGFDTNFGYGRIDVINSLQLAAPQPCTTNPECDDGLFCNGSETCVATVCQPGTDPCPGQSCDEVANTCVPLPSLVYEWNMNTNPGWTTQGQWAWGVPTGGGGQYGGPDPTSGATGSNVYGYNLAGDYTNALAETHLTSTAINCTGLTSVTLRFQRWLGVEVNTYDHAYVRVSNNGSTWTTVWSNSAEIADTAWSLQEFDISAVADNQATVYLRWTMGTTDSSWQFCGWNIDDVQILAIGGGCIVNADCDDGLSCNGAETCVGGTCQAGTAVNCNDGVACTTDACNEPGGTCSNTPNNAACSDGLACNGTETCSATLGCQAGTAVSCNDGVACTTDACTEPGGTCSYTPNNAACSDGLFCNGSETCNATLGCQAGTDPCPGVTCDETNNVCIGGAEVWMSFVAATSVPVVGTVANEDIVARNESSGAWSLIFDGSDVGLSGFVIDGMARLLDGSILLSFTVSGTVAGMTGGPGGSTTLDDSDIVRFVPTSLGATTAGSFIFYFDGSDVGLSTDNEDIDAIAINSSGQLVISTLGTVSATGASGADTDMLVFTATSLGSVTSGSFAVYFDGSDVSLTDGGSEDVDAVSIMPDGKLLISTLGNVSVPGVSGANEDVLRFTPTTLGTTTSGTYSMYLDLSMLGISTGADVGSVEYKP
jgi:subtilisin family serine protease